MSTQLPPQEQTQLRKEEFTVEEKVAQVAEAMKPNDDDITELDEFKIIENKGIEYILIHPKRKKEDLKLYITPLSMRDHGLYLETMETMKGKNTTEQNNLVTEFIAKILDVDLELLKEYVTYEDLPIITALFACAIYEGKKLFKKKTIDKTIFLGALKTIQSATINLG